MEAVYKRILMKDQTLTHAELEAMNEHGLCYSALLYISQGDAPGLQQVLVKINLEQPEHVCPLLLEAKAHNSFSNREFGTAGESALRAVTENPGSLFAYVVLARLAISQRMYAQAIQYYQKILVEFPESKSAALNIAGAYAMCKNWKEAGRYIDLARPSMRKRWHKFLFSFSFFTTRLIWVLAILASLLDPYLLVGLYALTTAIFIYVFLHFGVKEGDFFITYRSVYIQLVHTFFFLFAGCWWLSYLLNS